MRKVYGIRPNQPRRSITRFLIRRTRRTKPTPSECRRTDPCRTWQRHQGAFEVPRWPRYQQHTDFGDGIDRKGLPTADAPWVVRVSGDGVRHCPGWEARRCPRDDAEPRRIVEAGEQKTQDDVWPRQGWLHSVNRRYRGSADRGWYLIIGEPGYSWGGFLANCQFDRIGFWHSRQRHWHVLLWGVPATCTELHKHYRVK